MELSPIEAISTPVGWGRLVLGYDFYKWQEDLLWDIALGDLPITLLAPNGSGKTSRVATTAVTWHCAVFPESEAVTTAGVYRQVKEQLWHNIGGLRDRLGPDWKINETDLSGPHGSRAIGFTAEDAGKFEGWHGANSGNLLMILDESKSIRNDIFHTVMRCNAPTKKRLLLMSSAGKEEGFFYDSHNRHAHLYSRHKVTWKDCPHITQKEVDEARELLGGDSNPTFRSMYYSEFMREGESDVVIPRHLIEDCRKSPPSARIDSRWAYIDWAAGGDECVIAILEGNKLLPLICWREENTDKSINMAVRYLRENKVRIGQAYADGGGIGIPMNRQMAEQGFPVTPVHNGSDANNKDQYENRSAEMWFRTKDVIRRREVILPPDEKLDTQLSNRRVFIASRGRLGMESKAEMKLRGVSSPDRADATCGVIGLVLSTRRLTKSAEESMFSPDEEPGDDDHEVNDRPGFFVA